jgi:hypothetical protein
MKQVPSFEKSERRSGLFLIEGSRVYPVKEILRVAYRLANDLQNDRAVKFSSGDGSLNVLTRLGFDAKRIAPDPLPGQT